MFKNKDVNLFFQLLMNLCFPLYIYAGFVYGEIPATAMILLGTYLFMKLLEEQRARNVQYGMVTACIGGGQGIAGIFEKL